MPYLLVSLDGMQFSFHSIAKDFVVKKEYQDTLEFDGIKKQFAASTIFNEVLKYNLDLTNKTMSDKDLLDSANEFLTKVINGELTCYDCRESQNI